MAKKTTEELENILDGTHINDVAEFVDENAQEMLGGERLFTDYMRDMIKKHDLTQQRVFIDADISEKYGYKLISGEKHTRERDVILRLCYAAKLTLKESQKALKLYGMSELYARIPRDAYLMAAFNERPGSILEVNSFLIQNKVTPLRNSGVQE